MSVGWEDLNNSDFISKITPDTVYADNDIYKKLIELWGSRSSFVSSDYKIKTPSSFILERSKIHILYDKSFIKNKYPVAAIYMVKTAVGLEIVRVDYIYNNKEIEDMTKKEIHMLLQTEGVYIKFNINNKDSLYLFMMPIVGPYIIKDKEKNNKLSLVLELPAPYVFFGKPYKSAMGAGKKRRKSKSKSRSKSKSKSKSKTKTRSKSKSKSRSKSKSKSKN